MSVSTTNSTQTFAGGQSVLTFNFRALTAFPNYINVSVVALTGGTVTALSYSTQYTVTISSTGVGGTVIVTPSYGSNYNYVVFRNTAILQSSSYSNYNAFPAGTLENGLDQLTMIEQEASTTNKLTLSYNIGTSTTYSTIIPIPSIGTVLGSDPTGTFYMNVPPGPSGSTGPIGPSGATGTISIVSSSTSDITVVSVSTTPIITAVNAGSSGANNILRLNNLGLIPTNLISAITAYGLSATSGSTISFSTIKILYGMLSAVPSTGTTLTNLPFSSSSSYIVVASINVVGATNAVVGVNVTSGSQCIISCVPQEPVCWVAIGV